MSDILIDVKFTSGDKEQSFWFLPIHRCVLALYTQYFPESCEQNHRHITRVGFEPKRETSLSETALFCVIHVDDLTL